MLAATGRPAMSWRRRAARRACVAAGVISASIACAAASAVPDGAPAVAEISVAAGGIEGFSSGGAAAERQLEQRFDSDLSAADLRSWMEQMSSEPNQVGSAHDKANAEFELKKFRE